MYTITDSICLKVLSTDSLLVAIGNDLHYYQQSKGHTVHKFFATSLYDKIHGIQSIRKSSTEFHVLVYGGREIALIRIRDHEFVHVNSVRLSDWISSVNFYEDEPKSFCCLTCHSVALRCSIVWHDEDHERAAIEVSERLSCTDKSTLYTSLILGTTWHSTVLFGGTALGYVFIWRGVEGTIEMLHRLAGHNGVIFSIDCNIKLGLMTTTSDDRSVKIWKINFANDSNWSDCTIKQVKSLYGHTARVFRCKIIDESNSPYIVSIGEDSNICVWSDSGSLLYRRRFNCGATLWNLDYDSTIKKVFLCGSDGNVREIGLENVFQRQAWTKEIVSNEILQGNEYLAKVKLTNNKKIIALTSENRLIYQNDCNEWSVCEFSSYKSCVLEKFGRHIAIAGYQRASVFEYDTFDSLRLIYEVPDLPNMVRSFKFLNENEYLLSDETGNCTFINRTSGVQLNFFLPTSKGTYITVALKQNDFLIVGDRTGDLHLYEIESNEVHHRHRLKHLHGNLGCTVLHSENGTFLTSGHDGTTKVIALNGACKKLAILLTQKLPVSWMERVVFRSGNRKLYAGFNDKHFVLTNDECDIVDEIDCGGGHRFWDLLVTENYGKFIFIRNKMLYSVTLSGYADDQQKFFQIPVLNWHTKSCNLIKCIDTGDGNVIVVSGGDDNILKFSKFNENVDSFMEHLVDMVQHISCVKTLTIVERSPMERFVVSAGGRAQICICKIAMNGSDITTEEVTSFMLNSTDIQRKRLGKSQMIDFDPETRFMSVSCTDDFHIFAGCSDGYIRQFHFDLTKREITSIDSIFYGKCLLHTHYLSHENRKYLLTMATDGNVCFWELTENNSINSQPFYQLKHHNSGINSFNIVPVKNRFIIATGGDDQSTVVSTFALGKKSVEVIETRHLYYHTAQVNGVKFSNNGSSLYSISVDQILYEVDLETFVPRKISGSTVA
ncbi:hypothetical protein HA402_001091 [Bradysia odoriphaga]|nr:hypothetical protein HA402_001091 [Bradysia odoriphaga]